MWSNENIVEFLNLYEQEEAIWNPKNKDHKDRNIVHDAWTRIEQKFSINCTISELKKKKESLMGTFRKLNAKVKASMKTGSSADDVFKPDWFVYEQMAKFLKSIYTPRETRNSDEQSQETESDDEMVSNVDPQEISASREVLEIPTPTTLRSNTFKAPTSVKAKKRKDSFDEQTKRKEEAYNFLKSMRDKPEEDECSLFGDLLCQKLRAFNKNMRDLIMHDIDCLIFKYRQQQTSLESSQEQVSIFPSQTRFSFPQFQPSPVFPPSNHFHSPVSHPEQSSGFISSPQSHSQASSGFSHSPISHPEQSSGFSSSPQSLSQASPGFLPSPVSHHEQSSGFSSSPQSHSQASPGFLPSPVSHPEQSSGFISSPQSHSQASSGFSHSPISHPEQYSGFSSSPQSHSQASPGFLPSPVSHPEQSSGFIHSPQSHSQASPGISHSPLSHPQQSLGFIHSPQSHSQASSSFSHFPFSNPQRSSGFIPFPQSRSHASPRFSHFSFSNPQQSLGFIPSPQGQSQASLERSSAPNNSQSPPYPEIPSPHSISKSSSDFNPDSPSNPQIPLSPYSTSHSPTKLACEPILDI